MYRYYVSASLQQGRSAPNDHSARLSAPAIERLVSEALTRWLPEERDPHRLLVAIRLTPSGMSCELTSNRPKLVAGRLQSDEELVIDNGGTVTIHVPLALPLRGGSKCLAAGRRNGNPDPTLIAALRKAHAMLGRERGRPIMSDAPVSPYDRRILRLAFLPPDLQRDILAGRQPASLNLEYLMARDIPLAWSEQRKTLGWA